MSRVRQKRPLKPSYSERGRLRTGLFQVRKHRKRTSSRTTKRACRGLRAASAAAWPERAESCVLVMQLTPTREAFGIDPPVFDCGEHGAGWFVGVRAIAEFALGLQFGDLGEHHIETVGHLAEMQRADSGRIQHPAAAGDRMQRARRRRMPTCEIMGANGAGELGGAGASGRQRVDESRLPTPEEPVSATVLPRPNQGRSFVSASGRRGSTTTTGRSRASPAACATKKPASSFVSALVRTRTGAISHCAAMAR